MNIVISTGSSRNAIDWTPKEVSWERFRRKLETPRVTSETMQEYAAMSRPEKVEVKDIGGFVGGTVEGRRKKETIRDRTMITLDADYADRRFWPRVCELFDCALLLYSTHSHTPEHPRFRLVIPLSHAVDVVQYGAIARKIAAMTGIECYDATTAEVNRLMFWPSISRDAEYIYQYQDGDFLDPEDILELYDDWSDSESWPKFKDEDKVQAGNGKRPDPRKKPGMVGAFCRAYPVSSAIDAFLSDIYEMESEGVYTFAHGTTANGAKVFDDDTELHSFHDHDPAKGQHNAYDLVRIHKFGNLDANVPAGIPISELPSTVVMNEWCLSLPDVMKEYTAADTAGTTGRSAEAYVWDLEKDSSDLNVAQRIADRYRDVLMYSPSLDWLYWNGQRWKPDSSVEARRCQEAYYNEEKYNLQQEASLAMDPAGKKAARAKLDKAIRRCSSGKISGVENLLKKKLPLPDLAMLDRNPWELNTPGGIVNLRTGELQERDAQHPHLFADHYCTHITTVTPAPGAPKKWLECMEYWTCHDADTIRYIQEVLGMACVGEVMSEGMVIVYGPGRNGKSTMFNVVSQLLGDYATPIRKEVVLDKGGGERYGIEALLGRRLAIMSELDPNDKLASGTFKALTSRDRVHANIKFEKPIVFTPTHTLVMHTNHLPRLGALDDGVKRRIAIVPFKATIPPSQVNPNLMSELIDEEGPQILQWMIDGAVRYYENHCILAKSYTVEKESNEYLNTQDKYRMFMTDCISQHDPGARVLGADLFRAFKQWCGSNGFPCGRNVNFFNAMLERGLKRDPTNTQRSVWVGVKLLDTDGDYGMDEEV